MRACARPDNGVAALQTVLPINDSIFEMELLALCNDAFQHPDLHGYAPSMMHAANFDDNPIHAQTVYKAIESQMDRDSSTLFIYWLAFPRTT